MSSLKLNAGFLETEWKPTDPDKDAAWDLYIELLTRASTQPLAAEEGTEKAAESIYSLFPTTRTILKARGRQCVQFTKLAVVVLNQIIRPFTSKWHHILRHNNLVDEDIRREFRKELADLQLRLLQYTRALADVAEVEDLTDLNVPR